MTECCLHNGIKFEAYLFYFKGVGKYKGIVQSTTGSSNSSSNLSYKQTYEQIPENNQAAI